MQNVEHRAADRAEETVHLDRSSLPALSLEGLPDVEELVETTNRAVERMKQEEAQASLSTHGSADKGNGQEKTAGRTEDFLGEEALVLLSRRRSQSEDFPHNRYPIMGLLPPLSRSKA